MNFLKENLKSEKQIGTPNKKIKPNEDSESNASDFQIQFKNLVFIKNISQTQNLFPPSTNNQSFSIDDHSFFNEINQNDAFLTNNDTDMNDEQDDKVPLKLTKRMNSFEQLNNNEYDHLLTEISLRRNNSMFAMVNFEENEDFGENIYLNQLLTLKSKISLTDSNNQNREILRNLKKDSHDDDHTNRLQKDYQIKENLGRCNPNKQGFICLNKLEKIFYYVKKVTLLGAGSDIAPKVETRQNFKEFISNLRTSRKQKSTLNEIQLASQQVKIYNKDKNGCLVRFYQYWIENNSLFMIYQLGSYSVADKTLVGQKLPESEVWSIIYDAAQSLKWIHEAKKIHMNIKPGNLIKSRGKYKLSDPLITIGHLQQYLQRLQLKKDNFYNAPEVISFRFYLQGVEFSRCQIYSLGMVLLENITSMPGSMKNQPTSQIKAYFKKQTQGYSSYLKRLLLKMIEKNPTKRPTFDELLCSNIEEQKQMNGDRIKNALRFKRSNSV